MNNTTNFENLQVLCDVGRDGRVRPWKEHKMANELLSLAYQEIDESKAARLRECATWLSYRKENSGVLKLSRANFCRVRLCPVCQWRRSLKAFGQTTKIIKAYESEKQHSYAMLTLTAKNCTADELSTVIDNLMAAWGRLTRRTPWLKVVLGWYRGLEVTHNTDPMSAAYDTYHPHFHVLLAFRKSYFTSRYYLPQAEWARLWRESLRCDYDPIVDIRKCRPDSTGSLAAATAEVTKYSTKSGDFIIPDDWDLTVETVRTLDKALNKRRFIAFGGELGELHRKLNLSDPEEGDLVHIDDENEECGEPAPEFMYFWYSGYRQYMGGNKI